MAAAGRAMKAKGARTKLKKKRPAGLGFSTPRVSDEPVTGYDTGPKLLEILKYPHPALRRPNAEVTDFGPKLRQLSENLFRTMYAKDNGCGLAAPQCGVNLRVMVYNYQRIEGEGRKPEDAGGLPLLPEFRGPSGAARVGGGAGGRLGWNPVYEAIRR